MVHQNFGRFAAIRDDDETILSGLVGEVELLLQPLARERGLNVVMTLH